MIRNEIVGIIPCAGHGSRLGTIPFSKELYPIEIVEKGDGKEIKVVLEYLMDQLIAGGVNDYHIILRNGKWGIPTFLDTKYASDLNFSFHLENNGFGVPYSIQKALSFAKNKICVLGFPDIIVKMRSNPYGMLLKKIEQDGDASLVLGIMPTDRPDKWDMVDFDSEGRVKQLVIKQETQLECGWFCAAWDWRFSQYIEDFVYNALENNTPEQILANEQYLGDIINAAIKDGLKVNTVRFDQGKSLDIGTLDDLERVSAFLDDKS